LLFTLNIVNYIEIEKQKEQAMQLGPVNWFTVGASVLVSFLIGGLWYSPLLFVNTWLRIVGVDRQVFNAGLPRALLGDLFSAVAIALALNQVIRWSGAIGVGGGLLVAFIVWVGFVTTILFPQVTYEHRPFAFFAISAGYRLVVFLAMGAILSA
jgi:hypothetical protein